VDQILSRLPDKHLAPLHESGNQGLARERIHTLGIKAFLTLRITNAGVEGYISKIRMVSHRAFGFHSAGALIAMLMLVCSGISLTPVGHG
jgi:transposase